jgi:hypothetical protein
VVHSAAFVERQVEETMKISIVIALLAVSGIFIVNAGHDRTSAGSYIGMSQTGVNGTFLTTKKPSTTKSSKAIQRKSTGEGNKK